MHWSRWNEVEARRMSPTMKRVEHDGRETAYRETGSGGSGPRILYVHGSGGTHESWVFQYGKMGPAHPAFALDLSGHGESDDVDTKPGHETLAAYVADVGAVASETDPDVIVGHSMGGAVVLQALLENAIDPDAVVLAGTGARLPVHEQIRTMLAENFENLIEWAHSGPYLFCDVGDEILDQSKATLRETGREVTQRDFLTCHEFDVSERLDEIETPALAVVGSEDNMTPPSYHEHLAAELPDCRLDTIEDVAHMLMIERPGAFNRALESFIGETVN